MIYSIIILVLFALVVLFGVKISPKGKFYDDYLGMDESNQIRAVMALAILIAHFSYPFENKYLLGIISPFAYIFVGAFLFYTGYGLLYSFYSKDNYLKGFLKKRLFSILFPFYIIVGIDSVYNAVVNGENYDFSYIFTSLYNNWYVLIITVTYIIFFVCFKLKFKNKNTNEALFAVLFTIASILLSVLTKQGFYVYSMLSLPLGMIWYHKKDSIQRAIRQKWFFAIAACFVFLLGCVALRFIAGNKGLLFVEALSLIASTPIFTVIIFILLNKVKIKNRALNFVGNISYEVYLCHRFIMNALLDYEKISSNMLLYFFAVITITIAISVIVHFVNVKMSKVLRIK